MRSVSLWSRDLFSGRCGSCARGAPPVNLGCGTLFAIGVIVFLVTSAAFDSLKQEVTRLRTEVRELKEAVEAQTREVQKSRSEPPAGKPADVVEK